MGRLWNISDYSSSNGQLLPKGSLQDGSGSVLSYHDNGELEAEGVYADGLPNGFWKYYDEKGRIIIEGNMTNGLEHGLWKFYYTNGKPKAQGYYLMGEKEGSWTYFYRDGSISDILDYDN